MVKYSEGKVEDLCTIPRTHIQSRGLSVSVISAKWEMKQKSVWNAKGQSAWCVHLPAGDPGRWRLTSAHSLIQPPNLLHDTHAQYTHRLKSHRLSLVLGVLCRRSLPPVPICWLFLGCIEPLAHPGLFTSSFFPLSASAFWLLHCHPFLSLPGSLLTQKGPALLLSKQDGPIITDTSKAETESLTFRTSLSNLDSVSV